jgi:hypothetical protein
MLQANNGREIQSFIELATVLKKCDQVHIMGLTGTWYLIDHAGVRGYAAKQSIEIV